MAIRKIFLPSGTNGLEKKEIFLNNHIFSPELIDPNQFIAARFLSLFEGEQVEGVFLVVDHFEG